MKLVSYLEGDKFYEILHANSDPDHAERLMLDQGLDLKTEGFIFLVDPKTGRERHYWNRDTREWEPI